MLFIIGGTVTVVRAAVATAAAVTYSIDTFGGLK